MTQLSRIGLAVSGSLLAACAHAQIADLLNTFDAGSKSFGAGSALTATDAEILSTFNNPAALGYMNHRELGISYRNLPTSKSSVSDVNGSRSSTGWSYGGTTVPSIGYVMPISLKSNKGSVGFSYNIGGYLSDSGSAAGTLPYGTTSTLEAANYSDKLYSRTEYYTAGWGKTNQTQNFSYGFAVTLARESLQYQQKYSVFDTSGGSPVLVSNQDTGLISGTSTGVGVIAGLEYVPEKQSNLSLGASLRSPIKLSGGNGTTNYFSTLPGRLLLGGGYRLGGLKNRSDDYTVIGAQFEQYYGGAASGSFSFDNQSVGDFGIEYGYSGDGYIIPVRVGARFSSSAGGNFDARNELTYGIGYRDKSNRYSIDLNVGNPKGAAREFAITASYRFANP
jgi:hypothetical protein